MVELRVLGALHLSASGRGDVESLVHQAKRAALLAYLAAAVPRGGHRRDKLLALFWPELDQDRARAALSQAVYVLRATLGEDAITPHGDGAVGITDLVWCDAAAFEAALDAGRPAEALSLYRGDLLDGFFVSDAPEFERWLDGERQRLRQRAAGGAWALAEAKAAEGDAFEAARWAKQAADLFPADEAGARRLMTFLHALGDRAAAIRAYEALCERLRHEYELEPSEETRALAVVIREERHRAAPGRSAALASSSVTTFPVPRHRRPPLRWIGASVVVAALGAGAWLFLSRGVVGPPPVVRFTLEFPADHEMAPGVGGPTLALSPDGSHLVYLARGPLGTQLFRRPLDRVEAVPIPHTNGARLPFLSSDGEWLGFVVGSSIRRVPLAGGPAITVCKVATNVPGASWGPNDEIVFSTPAGLWRVPATGGEPRLLAPADTARGERYRWPEVLPTGRAAVFTRVNDEGFRLAAVSLETGAVRPLGVEGTNPRFVVPGYLVFARQDGALLAAAFDPVALRITGPVLPVAEGVDVGIAGAAKMGVSRSGTLAYVPQPPADGTLVMVDRTGAEEALRVSRRGLTGTALSPDGRQLAGSFRPAHGDLHDIWVADLSTGALRRLTFDSGSFTPVWSPDGRRIAFATKPGGRQFGVAIRWMLADAGDSAETLVPGEHQFPSAFAPDGQTLVLERQHPETRFDIWILPLTGDRSPQPYLRTPFDERGSAVSPDGRWLAYVSDESGEDEVYVRAFPRPGPALVVSSGGGHEPRWAPSGRELFYRNERGLVVAAVEPSAPFRVVRRTVLFDDEPFLSSTGAAAYDIHPDGRRFLMIRRGAQTPQVVVVLNWLDQLGAGAPAPQ